MYPIQKGRVRVIHGNIVRLGYLLAISLLLSALLYFFASNWPALDRWEKIGVSAAVLALFYLTSYLVSLFWKRQAFISNWLLVAGGISFGITVALLGQIYNSHADSYLLFVVWLVPNLLFAVLTRYQPFYVLSYVLVHLVIWFYLNQSSLRLRWEDQWWFLFYWLIALGNLALFWLTSRKTPDLPVVRILSFLVFCTALLVMSFVDVYSFIPELLYILVNIALFYAFLKWRPQRGLLLVTSGFLTIFALYQFIYYMFTYPSLGYMLIGLLLVVGLVAGSTVLVKRLRQHEQVTSSRWFRVFREVFTALIVTVASLLGTLSIIALASLTSLDDVLGEFGFFLLTVVVFLLPAVLAKRMDATVRYTLLGVGLLLGFYFSQYNDNALWIVFLAIIAGLWVLVPSLPGRLMAQVAFSLVLHMNLYILFWNKAGLWAVFLLQTALYLWPRLHPVLRGTSLFYGLFVLLTLAESYTQMAGLWLNLGFFALSTFLLYWTLRTGRVWEFRLSLGFWFVFLLMKYHDFLWSLLHKSFSLLLLSVLFFLVSYTLELRSGQQVSAARPPVWASKRLALALVIMLQFAVAGYQVWSSEAILAKGTLVKLELRPFDPRSLLQGDYVRLSYSFSRLSNELPSNEKIRVVLRKTEDDVYDFSGYYELGGTWNRTYQAEAGDVIINGRVYGYGNVEYGIENYFIPEGTGREVEEKAKYALVRVAANGDAIVEGLAEK